MLTHLRTQHRAIEKGIKAINEYLGRVSQGAALDDQGRCRIQFENVGLHVLVRPEHNMVIFKTFINFLPDPAFAIDVHGRVIAWTRAIEELTGVRAEDMMGKGDYEYALPFYGQRRPVLVDLCLRWDGRGYSAIWMETCAKACWTRKAKV